MTRAGSGLTVTSRTRASRCAAASTSRAFAFVQCPAWRGPRSRSPTRRRMAKSVDGVAWPFRVFAPVQNIVPRYSQCRNLVCPLAVTHTYSPPWLPLFRDPSYVVAAAGWHYTLGSDARTHRIPFHACVRTYTTTAGRVRPCIIVQSSTISSE
jgi:hypothetical protein